MATRRMPNMGGGGAGAAMAGGMQPGMMNGGGGDGAEGGGGPRMPRPPMTGAPAGNANPNAMNGIPMAPPPVQPTAGGPTSPFNIQSMLQTNRGNAGGGGAAPGGADPQAPQRRPLMPWGNSHGEPAGGGDQGQAPMAFGGAEGASPGMGAPNGGMDDPTKGPLVMLRLMKAMGQL